MSLVDLSTARWRKSSRSNGTYACVEVATVEHGVAVRDSKDPTGPALVLPNADWSTFVTALQNGSLSQG